MAEVLDPPAKQAQKSGDSTFELLKENMEAAKGAQKPAAQVPAGAPAAKDENDLTASFQEKFTPLQKDGKIEDINKLRAEVDAAVKGGKKVSTEFLTQLELSAETPEQKQIREVTAQKEAIQADLKLSETEKAEALKKLEGVKEVNFWEKEDFGTTPVPEAQKDENKEKLKKAEADKLVALKAKQFDEIEADPFVKAYLSSKQAGKGVDTFLAETTTNNPANLSDEQVLDKRIARFALSEDDAAEERESFKTMSPTGRKELIAKERGLLNADYKKNFEKYSTSNAAESERLLSVANKGIKEANDFLASVQGKEVWGITYDSTQIQKLEDFAQGIMQNGLFKEDGSWDVPKIMRLGMKELNTQHMLQKAYEKGQYAANEEWYKTHARPSANNGIAKVPDASIVNKDKAADEQQKAEWRKKNNLSEVVPAGR